MGWTSVNVDFGSKDSGEIKKFLTHEWNQLKHFEVVDYSKKGNTVYMAIKHLNHDEVFAVVTLISFDNGEFYWKEVSEDMGPCRIECPKRILNLLTETDNEYAKEWRENCLRYHEMKREAAKKYHHGDILKFPRKITFTDGFEGSYFILLKDGRSTTFSVYREQESMGDVYPMYRITNWKNSNPEVVGHLS